MKPLSTSTAHITATNPTSTCMFDFIYGRPAILERAVQVSVRPTRPPPSMDERASLGLA